MNSDVKTDPFAALRYRNFRVYLAMSFFFTLAFQMQTIVVGFFVYQVTHNMFALGMLGLSEAIPALSIALYGGYIADKAEKRKLLIQIHTVVILSSAVIFIISLRNVAVIIPKESILFVIYGMLGLNGAARAFYAPAAFTIYADSIGKQDYPNGSTWNNTVKRMAYIIGPAAGGLIYAFAGLTASFFMILTGILVSLYFVYHLKKHPPSFLPDERIWSSLNQGLNFVFKNKMMLRVMALDLFSVFFGGVIALLPAFAGSVFNVGADGLGIMRAIFSAGSVLALLVMSRYSPMNKPWRNLLLTVTGFGCSVICFGLSHNYYFALVFLFMQGVFDSVSVTIRATILQLLTPDNMRGRVSAVNSMFIGSSNELGDFESGTAASLLGLRPAVLFGGAMTLSIVAFTHYKTRNLLNIINDESARN